MIQTIPGLSIIERGEPRVTSTPTSISRLCLLTSATPADVANYNKLIAIADLADFQLKYTSNVTDTTLASVRLIFRNYPQARVSIFAGHDTAITNPNDKGHLIFGAKELAKKTNLDLHILVCPEAPDVTAQADRTALFTELENVALRLGWIHYFNTAKGVDTKAEAETEAALYSSPFGKSSLYYDFGIDLEGKQVPSSVIASVISLLRFRDNAYNPPAGVRYPIKGITGMVGYIEPIQEYEDLLNKGVNTIRDIPSYGWCVWGTRTLASDPNFQNINTVVAMNIISRQLLLSLLPELFEPSDPRGYTRGQVIRLIVEVLDRAYTDGALSGETPQESYRIVEREVPVTDKTNSVTTGGDNTDKPPTSGEDTTQTTTPTPTVRRNLRRIKISAYCKFVQALEMIEIDLINVDVVPTGAV